MALLILGKPKYSAFYRGTDRQYPSYHNELDDNHPVNSLFRWFCAQSPASDFGLVHNLQNALKLVEVYRQLPEPDLFEIVELTKIGETPRYLGEFLGYDISGFGYAYSLLGEGLEVKPIPVAISSDSPYSLIYPLIKLLSQFFQPQLNHNGLFDDTKTAQFCLECMMALQKVHPGLYENESIVFEVVGLWKLY